ncbi:MAG: TetR family transcriptional regulator [Methylococcales bacterium]
MARRNEHSLEEIKAMVLTAAENIILEEGCAALTIRKIAMEIGYTVGSVYMVFASRADLILHINARTLEDIAIHLQPISRSGDIEVWLNAYLQYARANTHRWRLLFTQSASENHTLPDWYQVQLNAIFQQFSAYFTCTSSERNPQAIQALWQGIHGVCLLSAETEIETSGLLLLKTFLRGWSV